MDAVTNNTIDNRLVNSYIKNGYALYNQQVFSPEKQKLLTEIFEEMYAVHGSTLSNELDTPHFRDERLLDFLLAPEVLDLVENFIGPNIGLWSSHFICKEPKMGKRTPWHEDSAYWEGRFNRMDGIITLWLAIDESTQENGCMGVIPGTHHDGFSNYVQVGQEDSIFEEEIDVNKIDLNKVKWFELKPGECSLHDGRIIHGANANTSNKRRCGYTMRYFNLDMKLNTNHPKNKTHKIWHARGENIAGNPLIYREE